MLPRQLPGRSACRKPAYAKFRSALYAFSANLLRGRCMGSSHFSSLVLVSLLLFAFGCASPNNARETSVKCFSPYDGTWSGTMISSGTTGQNGDPSSQKPYSMSYSLKINIACGSVGTTGQGATLYLHNVTYAMASDPFFGCTSGCTPLPGSYVALPSPGQTGGGMEIDYPNAMQSGNGKANFTVSADGKSAVMDVPNSEESVAGSSGTGPNGGAASHQRIELTKVG